jgi:hypothetical protein
MLYAILICSDESCAEEFEAWGEPGELDTLCCEGCGCGLQPLAFAEARPALSLARAPAGSLDHMCRNIRTLYNFEPPATQEEIRDAALQYVRKVSGFTKPSQANREAFERAVEAVTESSARLLAELVTNAPPKDREVEAAKRRARSAERYAA